MLHLAETVLNMSDRAGMVESIIQIADKTKPVGFDRISVPLL